MSFWKSLAVLTLAAGALAQVPPSQLSSKATIATRSEPGERLVLQGTVYAADGTKPMPNVTLYAYHTDATGVYSKPVNDSRNPRLKGWVKTDAQGKFELDTIRPAAYPDGGNPAHIHLVVYEGSREAGHDECWFEGDRFLSERQKAAAKAAGKFARVLKLTQDATGTWRGEWNIRMGTD